MQNLIRTIKSFLIGGVKSPWLIRIEAINFDTTIEDTEQLSVRRGASIAMNNAIKLIAENKQLDLEIIRIGGSIGIFQVFATDQGIESKVREINSKLKDGVNIPILPSIGFTVSYTSLEENSENSSLDKETSESFQQALQQTEAQSHFQQLQMPSFSFATAFANKKAVRPCDLDGRLPQEDKVGNLHVSAFSKSRFIYGNKNKRTFINNILGDDTKYDYVNDFHEMTAVYDDDEYIKKLRNKMAVLYFDGNAFGKMQSDMNKDDLKSFEENLIKARKQFLKELTDVFSRIDSLKNKEKLRLELLLWGGDEIMLVVPAWAGFYTLQLFYSVMREQLSKQMKDLSHAGGLVFCNCKTPINRISRLSRELAERAKSVSRKADLFYTMLLESEDYPTQALTDHWEQHYDVLGRVLLPQEPHKNDTLPDFAEYRDQSISRSAIYKLTHELFELAAKESIIPDDLDIAIKTLEEKAIGTANNRVNFDRNTVAKYFPLLEVDEHAIRAEKTDLENVTEFINRSFEMKQIQSWLYLVEYGDYLINPFATPLKSQDKEVKQ